MPTIYELSLYILAAVWGLVAGGLAASRRWLLSSAAGLAKSLYLAALYGPSAATILAAASLAMHVGLAVLAAAHLALAYSVVAMSAGWSGLAWLYTASRAVIDYAALVSAAAAAACLGVRAYLALRGLRPSACSVAVEALVLAAYATYATPLYHLAAAAALAAAAFLASSHFGRVGRLYSKAILPRLLSGAGA